MCGMSIYDGLNLPNIDLGQAGPLIIGVIAVIAIILIGFFVLPSIGSSLNPSLGIAWTNNPLDLKKDASIPAELQITLTNTTDKMMSVTLTVTTESSEIIIFCPRPEGKSTITFDNVDAANKRTITCLVRRNPSASIFSGSYTITVATDKLGSAKTTLEVKTS